MPREDGFDITVASEVMAAFCLASTLTDLKERISRMVIGYTRDDKPITAGDLKAAGALTALLKDAIKPNLVQTLEGTPAFIHGGPFANIAHGCNSLMATRTAMHFADYVVTEAGFGADLGAEKFIDIKCRMANIKPDAVIIVATVRALKSHGGVAKADLNEENLEALKKGLPNLMKHVENITQVFGLPAVVAINRFPLDTEAELAMVREACNAAGVNVALSEVWAKGGRVSRQQLSRIHRMKAVHVFFRRDAVLHLFFFQMLWQGAENQNAVDRRVLIMPVQQVEKSFLADALRHHFAVHLNAYRLAPLDDGPFICLIIRLFSGSNQG